MQPLGGWRLYAGICFALLVIWLGVEYSGQRLHALSAAEQLIEKMLVVKIEVDSALKSNTSFDKSKIHALEARLAAEEIQIFVGVDGEINGVNGEIKLKFTPKKEGNSIQWTCSGTPRDKLPSSCR